jgi:outer membrane biosynthesis protein TonB
MDVRQLIRPGITASALVHLLLLGLVFLFSEVHPFGTVTAEPIAVDLVTPAEVAKEQEDEKPLPQLQLPKDDNAAATQPAESAASSPPPSPAPVAPAKQQQAARPDRREAAAQTQPQPQPQPAPQAAASMPTPTLPQPPQQQPPQQQQAYAPPEPDLTVKYGVILGLPDALPPPSSDDKSGDGIDANASSAADIASSLIAKFREHLKTCSKLPASVARSDNVFVKLRVAMTPQARLAAEPVLIEGTASVKALALKESAVHALTACQPYDMLPVNRYGEWKVLDLPFAPKDFG